MLAGGSCANDKESTYIESRKNSPAIQNTTPDLFAIIEDAGNILEVFDKGFAELNYPMTLFR